MDEKQASIVIVDSRGDLHPDWVQVAIESAANQTVPVEVIVVPNRDRAHTIGECWNKGVSMATTDWVLFLGDDDYLSRDYVQTLLGYANESLEYPMVTTYMIAFEDGTDKNSLLTRIATGMWRKSYLDAHPFNETLTKGIDREYIEQLLHDGGSYLVVPYHFGYFYRKHTDYSCAGKISFQEKPSDYYFLASSQAFLDPIAKRLEADGKDVFLTSYAFDGALADKAKVIWVDWGGETAIAAGQYKCNARKILRIHAFEVFQEKALYIDYDAYDKVIFVADHIRQYLEKRLGRKLANSVIIPNGIDTDTMQIAEGKQRNNKIAWAGYITQKKGISLLLWLANNLPDYEFHVAGKFQENDMAELMHQKKPDNMTLYTWQYDLNSFFADKTYILNTSPRESHGVAIMEGMAAGLKPLVYDWIGAEDIYPGYTFKNMKELENLLAGEYAPNMYRQWVKTGYSWDVIYPKLDKIIHG